MVMLVYELLLLLRSWMWLEQVNSLNEYWQVDIVVVHEKNVHLYEISSHQMKHEIGIAHMIG